MSLINHLSRTQEQTYGLYRRDLWRTLLCNGMDSPDIQRRLTKVCENIVSAEILPSWTEEDRDRMKENCGTSGILQVGSKPPKLLSYIYMLCFK